MQLFGQDIRENRVTSCFGALLSLKWDVLPSFPLANMSTKYLERSALALHRFFSIVNDPKKSVSEPLQPVPTRILEEVAEVVEDIFIVPGGRFLITKNDEAIRAWDISADVAKPRLLASKLGFSPEFLDAYY
ncbi:hypothetical protein C0993_009431 [Termitomyces sp. T159_Od127]|nr:hypothetical protein C0993_009431 [Termitomyces sp. T159_Od127]